MRWRRRRRSWSRSSCRRSSSLGEVQRVLRQLLRERVPVRDLATILEAMADAAPVTKDPDAITEAVRASHRPRHLPAVSEREGRAAGHRRGAGARGAAHGVARPDGAGRGAGARPAAGPEHGLARSRAPSSRRWHSLCSSVRRRCGRTCGGCSRGCFRTSACCRTQRCPHTCTSSPWRRSTDMHLKRYRRETVREALRAVREDLGPDALVLSTQLVAASGWRGWMGGACGRGHGGGGAAGRVGAPTCRRTPVDVTRSIAPSTELAARLQARAASTPRWRATSPRRMPAEPPPRRDAAQRCATRSPTSSRRWRADDDDFAPVEVFVGPPGVGKTTTIAKIAAQERARHGERARARRRRRVPRRRRRAAAPLRRHPRRAAHGRAHAGRARVTRSRGAQAPDARRHRRAARRPTTCRARCSRVLGRPHGRAHAPRARRRHAAGAPARRILDRFQRCAPVARRDHQARRSRIARAARRRAARAAACPSRIWAPVSACPKTCERATPPALAAWVARRRHGEGAVA